MADAEKRPMTDQEIAEVLGGKEEVIIEGDTWYRYRPKDDVVTYCPRCKGTEFVYDDPFWIIELCCLKCHYTFFKDLEGASSVGGDW